MTRIAHGFDKEKPKVFKPNAAKPKTSTKHAFQEITPFKSNEGSRKPLTKAAKHKSGHRG